MPRPHCHLVTYHGVLAPAAHWRDLIVPAVPSSPESSPKIRCASRRSTWAELLQRVFAIDVLTCPYCGAKRKLIALINDGVVVRKILSHLGLPTEPPDLAPAGVTAELAFDA